MIREVIVVEGKDDIAAVKASLDAEVLATHGFGYGKELINTLRRISKRRGLIILTDPDYMGDKIRKDLSSKIENCKHAFLPKGKALKKGDIGVENASKEDIIEAVKKARPVNIKRRDLYTERDMIRHGLNGGLDSKRKREELGYILGIGYANSKQFLNRLNSFDIGRDELIRAMERINCNEKG